MVPHPGGNFLFLFCFSLFCFMWDLTCRGVLWLVVSTVAQV